MEDWRVRNIKQIVFGNIISYGLLLEADDDSVYCDCALISHFERSFMQYNQRMCKGGTERTWEQLNCDGALTIAPMQWNKTGKQVFIDCIKNRSIYSRTFL